MQDDVDVDGGRPNGEPGIAAEADAEASASGLIAGRYRIVRRLGSGAMGEVFEVTHPTLPRHEAVKLLASSFTADPDFKSRFLREADVMSSLMHTNIVTVFDRGEDESGRMWLAMELVNGQDAAELLAMHGPMPLSLVADVVAGAGAALDFAWRTRQVTHRDVKPANIMIGLGDNGNAELVKLADFGIAKASGGATELTATGLMVGTLAYMSPEALEGRALDGFADQYSLGCTAFALLTGRSPYAADSRAVMIAGHLNRPVSAITALRPDLRPELNAVFERVLAKDPAERFGSCAQFAEAIRAAAESSALRAPLPMAQARPVAIHDKLGSGGTAGSHGAFGPTDVRPASPGTSESSVTKPRTRRRSTLIGGAVGVAALLGVAAVALTQAGGPAGSGTPDSVIATIAVGNSPRGVTVTPNGATAYISNSEDGTVSVVDTAMKKVAETITVGQYPTEVAVNPSGTTAYVTNAQDGTVSVIDTATNTVTSTITPPTGDGGVVLNPVDATAYVIESAAGSITILDAATNAVTATISVGHSPVDVAEAPSGAIAYVVNLGDDSVSVIDTVTCAVTTTIPVGQDPMDVAFTPNSATAYVSNYADSSDGSVSVIDTATSAVTTTIPVGHGPGDVDVTRNGAVAYVTNGKDGSVSVIDTATNTVTKTVAVGDMPGGVAASPEGAALYVTNVRDGTVSVISLR